MPDIKKGQIIRLAYPVSGWMPDIKKGRLSGRISGASLILCKRKKHEKFRGDQYFDILVSDLKYISGIEGAEISTISTNNE